MRIATFTLIAMLLAAGFWKVSEHRGKSGQRSAIFAAGCFWGVQGAFDHVPGVVSTEAGYTGGTDTHPNHSSVALGRGGHVEAVRVTYDPSQISYPELLDVFWSCHDPTADLSVAPGQGAARSMIYTCDATQEQMARRSQAEAEKFYTHPIVTQIEPAATFYAAEAEHQHYEDLHGTRCAARGNAIHTRLAEDARRLRTAR